MEVEHDVGVGVVGEELEGYGVNYGRGGLEAEVVLAGEVFLVLVIEMERQDVPCVDVLVVGGGEGKGLDLVVEETEAFDIGEVLEESRIDVVRVQCIPLDDWKYQSEDGEDVCNSSGGQRPKGFFEEWFESHAGRGGRSAIVAARHFSLGVD